MKEAELKRLVEDYLIIMQNLGKLVFLRLNSGDFIEVRGNTRRRIKGCPKGTADLLVLQNNGRYDALNKFYCLPIFLELKSPIGKQSKEQKEFEAQVKEQGAEYHIVRSLEEVQEILNLEEA